MVLHARTCFVAVGDASYDVACKAHGAPQHDAQIGHEIALHQQVGLQAGIRSKRRNSAKQAYLGQCMEQKRDACTPRKDITLHLQVDNTHRGFANVVVAG